MQARKNALYATGHKHACMFHILLVCFRIISEHPLFLILCKEIINGYHYKPEDYYKESWPENRKADTGNAQPQILRMPDY